MVLRKTSHPQRIPNPKSQSQIKGKEVHTWPLLMPTAIPLRSLRFSAAMSSVGRRGVEGCRWETNFERGKKVHGWVCGSRDAALNGLASFLGWEIEMR